MKKNAEYWISRLNLSEHAEGGYFRETYRAKERVAKEALPKRYSGDRAFSTAIYFLLKNDQISRIHKLKSDEMWHFYTGSPLTIHVIDQKGAYNRLRLGQDHENGEAFQTIVRGGCWFGATVDKKNSYSLVGCTVSPGFDFDDFDLGKREILVLQYPHLADMIERLTD